MRKSQVMAIRVMAHEGAAIGALAKLYDVKRSVIERIVRGLDYPDVEGPTRKGMVTVLTDSEVIEIRERRSQGGKVEDLAKEYRIGQSMISRICRGDSYAEVGGPITRR